MTGYHEAAAANALAALNNTNKINDNQGINAMQAHSAYTGQLALATIANTQALLAINDTLRTIADTLRNVR